MVKLETNRIRGYLDLDSYFRKNLGRNFYDLEDLYINGLIDYEIDGISAKFWILSPKDGRRIALYKEEIPNSHESYIELLVEEVAKVMGIPAAHYDLAMFNGSKGVISYNFLKDNSNYDSGFDIISLFYAEQLDNNIELCELYNIDYDNDSIDDVCDKLNNLQDIWSILEYRYKNNPNKQKIVKTIMKGLIDKFILDIVVVGIDGHADNWQVINDEHASCVFDNSRALGIHTKFFGSKIDYDRALQDNKLLLKVDDENINKPLEVLDYFLKISSSEYNELIFDKISKLEGKINSIPKIIERRTMSPIPNYLKTYFISNVSDHIDKINDVLAKNKVPQKQKVHIL